MVPVCRVDDVPLGEGRAVTLDGRRVALFHTRDGWFALDHVCPHKGGPLADGLLADSSVTCPLHERRFDLRSGEALGHDCGVAVHPVHVEGGEVFVGCAAWSSPAAGPRSMS
jgi:nitrite reductase (NADH) small subunit